MKLVKFENIILNKRYYIEVPETNYSNIEKTNKYKVSGKVKKILPNKIMFWKLKYVNNKYFNINIIEGKPILLVLYKRDNKMYRIMNSTLTDELVYKNETTVYEIENEKRNINLVLRNIIGDPYFDYTL